MRHCRTRRLFLLHSTWRHQHQAPVGHVPGGVRHQHQAPVGDVPGGVHQHQAPVGHVPGGAPVMKVLHSVIQWYSLRSVIDFCLALNISHLREMMALIRVASHCDFCLWATSSYLENLPLELDTLPSPRLPGVTDVWLLHLSISS